MTTSMFNAKLLPTAPPLFPATFIAAFVYIFCR
ncbi:ilvB operon leader peptide IvbL [Escherichia coli]